MIDSMDTALNSDVKSKDSKSVLRDTKYLYTRSTSVSLGLASKITFILQNKEDIKEMPLLAVEEVTKFLWALVGQDALCCAALIWN